MKRIVLMILLCALLIPTVSAEEFTVPSAPESAQKYMPPEIQSFGEGLWFVLKKGMQEFAPGMAKAAAACVSVIAVTLLMSVFTSFSESTNNASNIAGAVAIGILLLEPTNSLIRLGTQTVTEMCEYEKLLLPVMTGALAGQGGLTSSAALYTGTAMFCAVLSAVISSLIVPMIYIFLCLSLANSALAENVLKNLRDGIKWAATWTLKLLLYVFTAYISITGVVSGSADAAAVKATKLAISGSVPLVGGILSDASETILVSAGIMKSTAGVYGLLVILSLCIGPFVRIGVQYLLLKLTAAVCNVFDNKKLSDLTADFSGAMGLILGMTGAVCLFLIISTVCFMKGVG